MTTTMKTLTDHTIIYDDECPLCKEYTKAFVKIGMLDKSGREPYSKMINGNHLNIDWNRARNEIALVNKKDNTVKYGVDSIETIICNSFPVFKVLFKARLFRFFIDRLYLFISYNRKVVAPGKGGEGSSTCIPDFNVSYRLAYLVFAWFFTSMILVFYSKLAAPLFPASDFTREFLVCGAQVFFQGAIVFFVRRDRAIHYLGNMMTISVVGALMLVPTFLLVEFIKSNLFYIAYFLVVVVFTFFEHLRRVKLLGLPWYISATWVLYRLIVLCIILYL
jgi:hypothetical protein